MKTREPLATISVDQLSLAFTCRTCLNTDSRQLLIPIFEDHKASGKSPYDLFDQLVFLKLKISENDGFPANICSSCMERLSAVNAFRTQCEKAQEILDRYFAELSEQHFYNDKIDPEEECTEFEYLVEPEHEDVSVKVESANSDNLLRCPTCRKVYKRKVHLERHIHSHSPNQSKSICLPVTSTTNSIDENETDPNVESVAFTKKIQCRYCNDMFASDELLADHIDVSHLKDRPYSCPLCRKSFQSASNRNTHMYLHNRGNPYKCDQCAQSFKSKVYLNRHRKAIHTIGSHRCDQCGASFTNTTKYEYHLKSHDPNKKYKCSYCTKSFLQQHHLLNHERTHTGKRPFLCNICGKGFKHESSFKVHLKIHEGIRTHVCSVCSKTFVQRSSYLQHMAKHKNVRRFQCEQCGKSFIQRTSLLTHLKKHSEDRIRQCQPSFTTTFSSLQPLMDHNSESLSAQQTCLGDVAKMKSKEPINANSAKEKKPSPMYKLMPYACQLCNKSFRLPSTLTTHLKIHNEERKYVCEECGSTFKRAEHLRVHVNGVHLKRKPYSCEVCHKSFAQSGDRNVHMRRHMNEKPHQCTYCGKGFRLAKALRAHVRLHTGEKPFVCIICNMSFISYTALACHTQKHQEETLESCRPIETDFTVSQLETSTNA
ncbi:zinc finger protein 883-like [Malaya genurostris]|uniref:zinc finger protein 883-like n=1 Tax=Malaya genurostris TaxID=325434 RepID=UPI0026F3C2E0|nr:zinc finger protein 883-like [Malaya genurostris]